MLINPGKFFLIVIFCIASFSISCAQIFEGDCQLCKDGHHNESRPYELNLKHEVPFITVSLISLSAGFIAQSINNKKFLNLEEINQLNKNNIFFLDRSLCCK